MSNKKPDLTASQLFKGFAVHVITGDEKRMLTCSNCHGAQTNHSINPKGEWICSVCGFNANAAGFDDANVSAMIGATVTLLGQMSSERRSFWIDYLMCAFAENVGPETLLQMSDTIHNLLNSSES